MFCISRCETLVKQAWKGSVDVELCWCLVGGVVHRCHSRAGMLHVGSKVKVSIALVGVTAGSCWGVVPKR